MKVLAVIVLAAGSIATAVLPHPKRPVSPSSATAAPEPDTLRASRSDVRLPLRHPTPHPRLRRRGHSRPAPLLDVTAYCATGSRTASGTWPHLGDVAVLDRRTRFGTRLLIDGNVYTVTDWIGHGSDVDIYMGAGAACEQRAAAWGRRRLRVVTVTR